MDLEQWFEMRTLSEDILARAVDDWVTPSEVIAVCHRRDLGSQDDVRDLALGLIARLIATGLLVPGDIREKGHLPWECTPGEAIVRIIGEWSAFPDTEMLRSGDIVWLDATPEGERIGEAVLLRERPAYLKHIQATEKRIAAGEKDRES
ncbi:hypothetical protein [Paenarthrobacter ilicis]|uniref:Uncharacterized protein n=1 Tax=Paenarthrobacter ilicis TaxID=43665 RepID=A0ABX0TKN0_9MICC|nr:hypothetical protein [Paenarthrobacter ilicis]MBM7791659.1 hypothetical protein [Paenarthrobacter ilicis]NIJ03135.1 hypothetical protein [Paenarthrobacter ilicis]